MGVRAPFKYTVAELEHLDMCIGAARYMAAGHREDFDPQFLRIHTACDSEIEAADVALCNEIAEQMECGMIGGEQI